MKHVGIGATFDALANAMPNAAVFAVDRDRNVIYWSRGAERVLGFSAVDVIGEHCLEANRCHQCLVGCGIAEHGRIRDVPLVLYRADGGAVRLRKSAQAFFDDDGSFAGGVEVLVPEHGEPAPDVRGEPGKASFHGLYTADPAMLRVFQVCRNVAQTNATVLVRGESGSGKELVARALHAESDRCDGPFVAVNCAALTPSLAESELFGHVRGAFTGATTDRAGIFVQAHGGTLFLDEVAELPSDLQAKLLRVLEQRTVRPVGGNRDVPVDVRLVAATHESLREAVKAGEFREDLMFRLRVVPIFLPPLRERRRDVNVLLWRFIGAANASGPRVIDRIAPDAMRALLDHTWPGNVRELKNVVEYAFAVGRGRELAVDELPPELRPRAAKDGRPKPGHTVDTAAAASSEDQAERIRAALHASGGHVGEAARLLGISRPTLWRWRKKHGI